MYRLSAAILLMCSGLLFVSGTNFAGDKDKDGEDKNGESKTVVLKGTITCAKCDLGVEKKCATVIVVKDKDQDVTYYFDKAGNKKFHGDICQTPKKGSVEGTVSTVEKKKIITIKKVTYDE